MRNVLIVMALTVLGVLLFGGTSLAVEMYRHYFLVSDVEPDIYVGNDVFFLKPWGSNTPSSSYIDVCTTSGGKHCGRLVKISNYEIALSEGYAVRKTGQRVEKQLVIPKDKVMIAKIYW